MPTVKTKKRRERGRKKTRLFRYPAHYFPVSNLVPWVIHLPTPTPHSFFISPHHLEWGDERPWERGCWEKKPDCFGILRITSQFPTSFPGSFISPPPLPTHFSSPHTIWGGEMRDPGNEVAKFPDNQDNIQEGLGELRLVFCIVFSFSQTGIRLFLHSAFDSTMNKISSWNNYNCAGAFMKFQTWK